MIASARNSLLALAVLGCLAASAPAAAQKLRVAVLPVEGPQGDKATQVIVKAARKAADFVLPSEWDASAKKLFATSRSASDLAAVAGDINVQVVITGKVKKSEAGWELSVGVRHGPTGKASVKLKYPLKGPRLDPATLRKLADDVPPALATAAAGAGTESPETPEVATQPGELLPSPEDEKEAPLVKKPVETATERPTWAPFVDASVGFIAGSRSFSFDEMSTPALRAGLVPGLLLDATVYPLAFLAAKPGRIADASGLGLGGTLNLDSPNDVTPCYVQSSTGSGCGAPTVDHYATSESRFEAGLRYHWNIFRRDDKAPELLASVQYGQHAFAIQQRQYIGEIRDVAHPTPRDIGPPGVAYAYVSLGLGFRMSFARRFALLLGLDYHILLDTGPIQTAAEWGPGSAFGLRANGAFDVRLWKGLYARLGGYFEYVGLSFNQPPMTHNIRPPCPCGTTNGATDTFYGGTLSVGYRY